MNNVTKFFLVALVILIPLTVAFVYFFYLPYLNQKPYEVLTPDVYEKGTTVSLYKETPPNFPAEVLLENRGLDYSSEVTTPQGKSQITLSYKTEKSVRAVVNLYTTTLPNIGWIITETTIYEKASVVTATNEDQSILISIVPLDEMETVVTFQFEQ